MHGMGSAAKRYTGCFGFWSKQSLYFKKFDSLGCALEMIALTSFTLVCADGSLVESAVVLQNSEFSFL